MSSNTIDLGEAFEAVKRHLDARNEVFHKGAIAGVDRESAPLDQLRELIDVAQRERHAILPEEMRAVDRAINALTHRIAGNRFRTSVGAEPLRVGKAEKPKPITMVEIMKEEQRESVLAKMRSESRQWPNEWVYEAADRAGSSKEGKSKRLNAEERAAILEKIGLNVRR